MLAQGQSSSAKTGGLAADVSSGLNFLKKKKKKDKKEDSSVARAILDGLANCSLNSTPVSSLSCCTALTMSLFLSESYTTLPWRFPLNQRKDCVPRTAWDMAQAAGHRFNISLQSHVRFIFKISWEICILLFKRSGLVLYKKIFNLLRKINNSGRYTTFFFHLLPITPGR